MKKASCKICRRLGVKLFLKGERCVSSRCAMVKRPYPPGPRGKRGGRRLSSYGLQLAEKQKLRNWYNLKERQLKKYVKEALAKRSGKTDAQEYLIERLEKRLDNVIFRAGLAPSRPLAKQLVSHNLFLVNAKKVNIPSYSVKVGDKIRVRENKEKNNFFEKLKVGLKSYQPPSWLKLDIKAMEIEVKARPSLEEASPPAEVSTIFEYYSR